MTVTPPTIRLRSRLTTVALALAAAMSVDTPVDAQWAEGAKLVADDGTGDDFFGGAVAISGDVAIVASEQNDEGGEDAGSAYVYRRTSGSWSEEAKLMADDAAEGQVLGNTVAIDGDVAIVGASLDGEIGAAAGAVYVFRHDAGDWTQEAKLLASDGASGDRFGIAVAMQDDLIVVGAYSDDDDGSNSGSVYVFGYDGDSWEQEQKLTASDAAQSAFFGFSVAIDDDVILVGATGDNDNGTDAGAAYVFRRVGASWSEEIKLLAADGDYFDGFGFAVDISGDVLIAGAFADVNGGAFTGSAYVFRRTGGVWSQDAKLMASDAAHGDLFGQTVAIDGDIAVVGADREDENGTDSGAVYVYRFDGASWYQSQKLMASDGAQHDNFGRSVALDDETAIVGAWRDDDMGAQSGAAYIVDGARMIGQVSGDRFGYAMANAGDVDGDGVDDLIVGAAFNDEAGNLAGKAYLVSGRTRSIVRSHLGQTAGDRFGRAVAAAGDADDDGVPDYVVAAPFHKNRRGALYVYSGATGEKLFKVEGNDNERLGWSVSGGFDADGDGHDDVLAGAPLNRDAGNKRGKVYAFSGVDGSQIAAWAGEADKDRLGWAVAVLGDIDGDGAADFAFGAPWNDEAAGNAGKVYVRSGDDLELLYELVGAEQGDGFGRAIAGAGRVDTDARDDIVVGSPLHDKSGANNAGRIDVYSGATGLRIFATTGQSADDRYGWSVAGAGDVNGDGRDDVLAASPWNDTAGSNRGRIYVRSGNGGGLLDLLDGEGNGDVAGFAVAGAGDLDDDGLDDFWIAAPNHDAPGGNTGRVYEVLSLPAAATAPAEPPGPDVTRDGRVDADDLIAMLQRLGSSTDACDADVNGDGRVGLEDVLEVVDALTPG